MTRALQRITVSLRVARLEEVAHELSNAVGMTMNALVTAGSDDLERVYDHLATATEESMRSTRALRTLMWEIRLLHQLVRECSEEHDEEASSVCIRDR